MIWIGIAVGGLMGGWLGSLMDRGSLLGVWSILMGGLGSIVGVLAGYKIGKEYFE